MATPGRTLSRAVSCLELRVAWAPGARSLRQRPSQAADCCFGRVVSGRVCKHRCPDLARRRDGRDATVPRPAFVSARVGEPLSVVVTSSVPGAVATRPRTRRLLNRGWCSPSTSAAGCTSCSAPTASPSLARAASCSSTPRSGCSRRWSAGSPDTLLSVQAARTQRPAELARPHGHAGGAHTGPLPAGGAVDRPGAPRRNGCDTGALSKNGGPGLFPRQVWFVGSGLSRSRAQ